MKHSSYSKSMALKAPLVSSMASQSVPRFQNTVKEAHRTFINDAAYHPNAESAILERKIKASRMEKDTFPSVREWAPEMWKNKREMLTNFISGTIMALLSVPTSMAYALMVDLPVEVGLYASIFGLIVYTFFGTSRHLIIGSTSTSFLILSQALSDYDVSTRLQVGTMIAGFVGIFYLLLGLGKLGFIENAYSLPTLQGYLVSASLFTALQQLKKIFHLEFSSNWFFIQLYELISSIGSWPVPSLIMAIICFTILAFLKYLKIAKYHHSMILNISPLFVVIGAAFFVKIFSLNEKYPSIAVPTNVPSSLPGVTFPFKMRSDFVSILFNAIKYGIVVFTEGLVISKSLAATHGYKINATYELISLGLANIVGSCFGCFPSVGSLVRSPINSSLGGTSQLSALISALWIIVFIYGASSLICLIPTTVIYCIVLLTVIVNTFDLKMLPFLWKHYRKDFVLYMSSLFLCLLIDLADGVLLCLIISIVWLLRRSSKPTWSLKHFQADDEENTINGNQRKESQNSDYEKDMEKRRSYLEGAMGLEISSHNKANVIKYDRRATMKQLEKIDQEVMSPKVNHLAPHGNEKRKVSVVSSLDLNIYDLCLCHDPNCPRRCHVLVITIYGHLSYFNANMLKEQADFISKMKSERKNRVTGEYSVKGLIYEMHLLRDIDYTAAVTLKEIITSITGHKDNDLSIMFARMKTELKETLEATGFNPLQMQNCEMDTLAVLFKLFYQIKSIEKERLEEEYKKQLEEMAQEQANQKTDNTALEVKPVGNLVHHNRLEFQFY